MFIINYTNKMKHIFMRAIFIMAVLTFSLGNYAQDIIVTNDARKIEAKVLEVSKSEIRYKEIDNLDGPTFVLGTDDINSIIYANGKVVFYNQQVATTSQPEVSPEQTQPKQEPAAKAVSSAPTVDESMAEILFLSGNAVTGQITALKSDHVAYIQDGKEYVVPATQVQKVTLLQNGQVKEYNNQNTTNIQTTSAQQENTTTIQPSASLKRGCIYRDNGEYMHNGAYISSREVARILEREDKAAYKQWKKAEGLLIGGSICTGIGGGLAIGGLILLIYGDNIPCIIMDCCALAPLGVGLGLALSSSSHYNKAIDIYNSKCNTATMQLKWYVAPNSVGLALAF